MKKEKKPAKDTDVRKIAAGIAIGREFQDLKRQLAEIATKTRMDSLILVQPSLMNDLLNSHKKASEMISETAKLYSGMFSPNQVLKELGEQIAKYSAHGKVGFNPLIFGGKIFGSVPPEWVERMKRTSEKLPDAIVLMGNAGWPLDYDVTPVEAVNLADMLEEGRQIEVDEHMSAVYQDGIDDIFATFAKRHPSRQHIFAEIIKCYEQEIYHAGISCVMSQIDGICNDFTSNDFFRSSHQTPNVTQHLMKQSGNKGNWLLGPIAKVPPVGRSVSDKKEGDLNRHAIMHGIDISYGSKINFFKSVAWLKYLSDVVWFDSRKNSSPNAD